MNVTRLKLRFAFLHKQISRYTRTSINKFRHVTMCTLTMNHMLLVELCLRKQPGDPRQWNRQPPVWLILILFIIFFWLAPPKSPTFKIIIQVIISLGIKLNWSSFKKNLQSL